MFFNFAEINGQLFFSSPPFPPAFTYLKSYMGDLLRNAYCLPGGLWLICFQCWNNVTIEQTTERYMYYVCTLYIVHCTRYGFLNADLFYGTRVYKISSKSIHVIKGLLCISKRFASNWGRCSVERSGVRSKLWFFNITINLPSPHFILLLPS